MRRFTIKKAMDGSGMGISRASDLETRSGNDALSVAALAAGVRYLVSIELKRRRDEARAVRKRTLTSDDLWPPNDGGGYRG